ncbi:MAG: hypothetical protein COB36_10165 [Alphaproteobacteria bacterium]|nr:MAG: hypothetical protein COB36_10165 [Alphaproteobacteria bacterium]
MWRWGVELLYRNYSRYFQVMIKIMQIPFDSKLSSRTTLWEATSAPGPELNALEGNFKADVAVIGAGIAGLSTALHLAEAGCSVIVIEAEAPGSGATGASGGLLAPDFIKHSPDDIENMLGQDWGKRLIRMVGTSTRQCFDLIEKHKISCDARQDGFWCPAHDMAVASRLKTRATEWRDRGYDVDFISSEKTQSELGSPHYCGSIYFSEGGAINPLAFSRGLAEAVIKQGADIYVNSPVLNLEQHLGGWRVSTENGVVDAKRVVLAANGGNAALHPAMRKTVLPLSVFEYATRPLSAADRARVLPNGGSFTDKQSYMFTARYDGEGRVIAALPDFFVKRSTSTIIKEASQRLLRHFPEMEDVSIEYLWKGTCMLNASLLPKIYDLNDGAYAIQACNGRGLANNVVLGKELAASLIHQDMNLLSVKAEAPRKVNGYFLAKYIPSMMMAFAYVRQ